MEEAGSSLQNIVKMNIYLVDMADYAAMNKVCAWHLSLSQSNHIPVTDPNKSSRPFQTRSRQEPVFASRNYLARPMYACIDDINSLESQTNPSQVEIECIAHL